MSDSRLLKVLKRHRDELAPALSDEVLEEIAEIEEHYQFDDDRRSAQKALREIFQGIADAAREKESV